jgi:YHS domain-containing protein
MYQSYRIASWVVALGLPIIMSGCSSQAPQEKQKTTMPAEKSAQEKPAEPGEQAGHASHEGHEQTGVAPAGVPEGLSELSTVDRAVAEKQRVCPVSGDVLGAMGKPYKVSVKGQTVFLCCPACEKEMVKNPDKYLAKMKTGTSE